MVTLMARTDIHYLVNPPVANDVLNELFQASWSDHTPRNFAQALQHSLAYVCAFDHDRLIGFVNAAWDGDCHAFLLDPTVHPDYRRQGIGSALVRGAVEAATVRDVEWIHVDFDAELRSFYERAGFVPTLAGLIHVRE
jgi:GNAT superfamily N-acetyltransferase